MLTSVNFWFTRDLWLIAPTYCSCCSSLRFALLFWVTTVDRVTNLPPPDFIDKVPRGEGKSKDSTDWHLVLLPSSESVCYVCICRTDPIHIFPVINVTLIWSVKPNPRAWKAQDQLVLSTTDSLVESIVLRTLPENTPLMDKVSVGKMIDKSWWQEPWGKLATQQRSAFYILPQANPSLTCFF